MQLNDIHLIDIELLKALSTICFGNKKLFGMHCCTNTSNKIIYRLLVVSLSLAESVGELPDYSRHGFPKSTCRQSNHLWPVCTYIDMNRLPTFIFTLFLWLSSYHQDSSHMTTKTFKDNYHYRWYFMYYFYQRNKNQSRLSYQ